jgi:hypothetical protein
MAKPEAMKPPAVDFNIDADAVKKAQKALDRIILRKEQEQEKAAPEK